MMKPSASLVVAAIVAVFVLLSSTFAVAQTSASPGATQPGPVEPAWEDPYGPGTFDLTVGFGGIWYPRLEPAVELGLIPIADNSVTLGIGMSVDVGYCLGCLLFGLIPELSVRSWYVTPMPKVVAHLNFLSKAIKQDYLDPYAGLMGGPSFFYTGVEWDPDGPDNNATAEDFGIGAVVGPFAGLKAMLGDFFLVYVEARYLIGFVSDTVRVESSAGDVEIVDRSDYLTWGLDYEFGLGVRF